MIARRFATVEPVFGILRGNTQLCRFSLRGQQKVDGQWTLYCLMHNIEKLAHHGYGRWGKTQVNTARVLTDVTGMGDPGGQLRDVAWLEDLRSDDKVRAILTIRTEALRCHQKWVFYSLVRRHAQPVALREQETRSCHSFES